MNAVTRRVIHMGFSCFFAAFVTLGAFGVKDAHQAKLPLAAIAGILGAAYFSRDGWDD